MGNSLPAFRLRTQIKCHKWKQVYVFSPDTSTSVKEASYKKKYKSGGWKIIIIYILSHWFKIFPHT